MFITSLIPLMKCIYPANWGAKIVKFSKMLKVEIKSPFSLEGKLFPTSTVLRIKKREKIQFKFEEFVSRSITQSFPPNKLTTFPHHLPETTLAVGSSHTNRPLQYCYNYRIFNETLVKVLSIGTQPPLQLLISLSPVSST